MSGAHGKIGLACAGGVVEGAFYEIGVLCALEDAIEGLELANLDIYIGVSAGAILSSCLANGIHPRIMRQAVLEQDIPDLNLLPEYLFKPAYREYICRALQVPGIAFNAVAKYLKRPRDISLFGALMDLGGALPVGIFDSDPLERYLAHVFTTHGRTNSFRELRPSLRVLAVNLNTSMLTAFGTDETAHVPISKAVQASAALPVVYCPVEIDGQYYIDGVARRTLNASAALEQGADLLFCINPVAPVDLDIAGEEGECVHPGLAGLGLPAVLSQTFRTMIHSRMRTGFRNYDFMYPDADVILIEPGLSDHSMFFSNIFSFANRYHVVDHGYAATLRYLLHNAGRLQPILGRHGYALRWDVLTEHFLPLPAPPVEAASPDLTTGEVVEETWAALDRLDRLLRRLSSVVTPGAVANGGP